MAVSRAAIDEVLGFCDKYLEKPDTIAAKFAFVSDAPLRQRIVDEYLVARYMYKLGQALDVGGDSKAAHTKFQIVQYAAIYEAILNHLLWHEFPTHPEVVKITSHVVYKQDAMWPKAIEVRSNGDEVHMCRRKVEPLSEVSVRFEDKVKAGVEIGFLTVATGDFVKGLYKLRNAIHLGSAIKNNTRYEIAQSLAAHENMRSFLKRARESVARKLKGRAIRKAKGKPIKLKAPHSP